MIAPFDVQAATEALLSTVPDDVRARSDAYFEGGYFLILWNYLFSGAVAILMLRQGVSVRMRDLAERVTRRANLQVFLYWCLYLLLVTVVLMPWTYYTGFHREHAYGLATQSAGEWFGDQMKVLVLALIFGGLAITTLYAVFRRAPKRWWMWGAGVSIALLLFAIALGPVYIAPLFNDFTALEDGPIRQAVLDMAYANGVGASDVFMSDASAQSTRISANVSGMFGTERITLNDNLLERCSPAEVIAVMGHELGHYVLNHNYESMIFFGVMAFLAAAFVKAGFDRFMRTLGPRWRIRGVDDPAGLPALAFLVATFGFVTTPINNNYIRANEAEADIYGLNAAREPDAFATVALKLADYRKLDPTPLEEFLFYDHPSGRTRVETAMRWKSKNLRENAEPP